jgi:hypothetical protein
MSLELKNKLKEILDPAASDDTRSVLSSLSDNESIILNTHIENHINNIDIKPFPAITLFELKRSPLGGFKFQIRLTLTIWAGAPSE